MTRVCLVSHYMPPHRGGIERVTERMADGYARAGHTVTWLATSVGGTAGIERRDGVERVRLPTSNILEDRFGMPYPLVAPAAVGQIRAAVSRSDIVHLHDCLYLPVVLADRAARHLGVPTIVTQHVGMVSFGAAMDLPLALAYRTVGRSVLRHARRVAFVSDHVRQWFLSHVDGAIASELVPNGIDTDMFGPADDWRRNAARARLGIPGGAPIVLYVGRLVPKKNIATLVSALREIDGPWHALVVGDGPERRRLEALHNRVTHFTDVRPANMPDLYAAADLFVLPSVGEGMPLAVLEALASGLAVVVSDDAPFRPLEAAGAQLVPPDPSSIAATIRSLLAEPATRARYGQLARRWAVAHASERASLDRYLQIIAEVTT